MPSSSIVIMRVRVVGTTKCNLDHATHGSNGIKMAQELQINSGGHAMAMKGGVHNLNMQAMRCQQLCTCNTPDLRSGVEFTPDPRQNEISKHNVAANTSGMRWSLSLHD